MSLRLNTGALCHVIPGLPTIHNTMTLVENGNETNTRTTRVKPDWGKPVEVEWEVPEDYIRSVTICGQRSVALTNLEDTPWPATRGLNHTKNGIVIEVQQCLIDFDLDRGT